MLERCKALSPCFNFLLLTFSGKSRRKRKGASFVDSGEDDSDRDPTYKDDELFDSDSGENVFMLFLLINYFLVCMACDC